MIKKTLSIFLLFIISFSFANAQVQKPTKEIETDDGVKVVPAMVLPKLTPPTMKELHILKCTKDKEFIGTKECEDVNKKEKEEVGFFEGIWNWIVSLF